VEVQQTIRNLDFSLLARPDFAIKRSTGPWSGTAIKAHRRRPKQNHRLYFKSPPKHFSDTMNFSTVATPKTSVYTWLHKYVVIDCCHFHPCQKSDSDGGDKNTVERRNQDNGKICLYIVAEINVPNTPSQDSPITICYTRR
jgi:hypothetical protein